MSQFKRDMTEAMRNPDYAYEFGRTERELEIVEMLQRAGFPRAVALITGQPSPFPPAEVEAVMKALDEMKVERNA